MFANQMVVSSILVLALYRTGIGYERIDDALIGGFLAIVFAVLLFPADPLRVLRRARVAVLDVLHGVLCRTADFAAGRKEIPSYWPLSAVDRVHEQLGGLISGPLHGPPGRAALTAAMAAARRRPGRRSPGRARGPVGRLGAAAGPPRRARPGRVQLASAAGTRRTRPSSWPPPRWPTRTPSKRANTPPRRTALLEVLHAVARDRREVVLADVVQACIDDLQRVIELRRLSA